MKIAYLIPQFPGQTHIFFWREIRALRGLGVDVEIVSTRKPPEDIVCHDWSDEAISQTLYLTPLNVSNIIEGLSAVLKAGPVRWLRCASVVCQAKQSPFRKRLQMLMLIPLAGYLVRLARKKSWQHFHAHSCADSALLLLYVRYLSGITYSMTLHGPLSMYGPSQKEKWLNAKFGITVTERLKREVLDAVPELQEEDVLVAPMGVDLEVFKRRIKYKHPNGKDPFKIVSCGRLHFSKGHQDLIRAVAQLHDEGINVRLKIMGEGRERPALEDLIDNFNLHEIVILTGSVSERVVRDELESAHLFALGSHDEAIGVATMEAMAMELPVVVTDVGGVKELVRDGIDGILVKPHSPSMFAEQIKNLLISEEKCRQMGRSGASRIAEYFQSNVSAKLIFNQLNLYYK